MWVLGKARTLDLSMPRTNVEAVKDNYFAVRTEARDYWNELQMNSSSAALSTTKSGIYKAELSGVVW